MMNNDIKTFMEDYNFKVSQHLIQIMQKLKITQISLSKKTGINQSTLSKILSNKSKITLEQMALICRALQIDPSEITSFKGMNNVNSILSTDFISESDNLVYDISRSAFKGYLNKYFFYFFSTISTELKLLHGTLELYKHEDNNRCKVKLVLNTGKYDVEGNEITKNYEGDMIISISLSSCYCILTNQEIGEMCFIIFSHMFLFSNDMICRMASVLTTSSGENRRPTLHRMVLSKYEFNLQKNSDDLQFLQGQLRLNNSDIIISKSSYEKLRKNSTVLKSCNLQNFFIDFERLNSLEEYYVIDETKLRNSKIPTISKILGISLLRENSIAPKYNKISTKTDEYLFKYIENTKKNEREK